MGSMNLGCQGSTSACAKSQEHSIVLEMHGERCELEPAKAPTKGSAISFQVKRCHGVGTSRCFA